MSDPTPPSVSPHTDPVLLAGHLIVPGSSDDVWAPAALSVGPGGISATDNQPRLSAAWADLEIGPGPHPNTYLLRTGEVAIWWTPNDDGAYQAALELMMPSAPTEAPPLSDGSPTSPTETASPDPTLDLTVEQHSSPALADPDYVEDPTLDAPPTSGEAAEKPVPPTEQSFSLPPTDSAPVDASPPDTSPFPDEPSVAPTPPPPATPDSELPSTTSTKDADQHSPTTPTGEPSPRVSRKWLPLVGVAAVALIAALSYLFVWESDPSGYLLTYPDGTRGYELGAEIAWADVPAENGVRAIGLRIPQDGRRPIVSSTTEIYGILLYLSSERQPTTSNLVFLGTSFVAPHLTTMGNDHDIPNYDDYLAMYSEIMSERGETEFGVSELYLWVVLDEEAPGTYELIFDLLDPS